MIKLLITLIILILAPIFINLLILLDLETSKTLYYSGRTLLHIAGVYQLISWLQVLNSKNN
jgi:hypothetical protein